MKSFKKEVDTDSTSQIWVRLWKETSQDVWNYISSKIDIKVEINCQMVKDTLNELL